MQDGLYKLRSETQASFDEAKSLEARWKNLEREQRDVYQVRSSPNIPHLNLPVTIVPLEVHPTVFDAQATPRNYSSR